MFLNRRFSKKKGKKKIPENTYRVIKISKEALYEFIYESFIANQEIFLDISDCTSVVNAFAVDWEESSFTFIARNAEDDCDSLDEIDVQKFSKAISDTTSTMYAEGGYIDLSYKQLKTESKRN